MVVAKSVWLQAGFPGHVFRDPPGCVQCPYQWNLGNPHQQVENSAGITQYSLKIRPAVKLHFALTLIQSPPAMPGQPHQCRVRADGCGCTHQHNFYRFIKSAPHPVLTDDLRFQEIRAPNRECRLGFLPERRNGGQFLHFPNTPQRRFSRKKHALLSSLPFCQKVHHLLVRWTTRLCSSARAFNCRCRRGKSSCIPQGPSLHPGQ